MWWLAEAAARLLWTSERPWLAFIGAMAAQILLVTGVVAAILRFRRGRVQ